MTRNIVVIATSTGADRTFTTSARTWGEFKMEIQGHYDFSSLKATENINKTTLDYDDSVLPTGDFELYLRPGKTKSGK
jgi:hypothetical protein